jgi:hypothetical protein
MTDSVSPDTSPFAQDARRSIDLWHGIAPPTPVAAAFLTSIEGLTEAFSRLEPVAFEVEPAGFVTVLERHAELGDA